MYAYQARLDPGLVVPESGFVLRRSGKHSLITAGPPTARQIEIRWSAGRGVAEAARTRLAAGIRLYRALIDPPISRSSPRPIDWLLGERMVLNGSRTRRERAVVLFCTGVAAILSAQLVVLVVALALFEPSSTMDGPSVFVAILLTGLLCTWYVIAGVAAWIAVVSAARRSKHARSNVLLAMTVVAVGHGLILIEFADTSTPALWISSGVSVLLATIPAALVYRE